MLFRCCLTLYCIMSQNGQTHLKILATWFLKCFWPFWGLIPFIHIIIIILRHFFYLRYLWRCLDLGLFMSYLMWTFHFQLHFHYDYRIISWIQTCSFAYSVEYVLLCPEPGCCLAFAGFLASFSLVLLIKALLITPCTLYCQSTVRFRVLQFLPFEFLYLNLE